MFKKHYQEKIVELKVRKQELKEAEKTAKQGNELHGIKKELRAVSVELENYLAAASRL